MTPPPTMATSAEPGRGDTRRGIGTDRRCRLHTRARRSEEGVVRKLCGAVVATVVAVLLGAPPAGANIDFSGPAFNILAPGEFGGLPANQFSTDQGSLYDALTPLQGNVTPGD